MTGQPGDLVASGFGSCADRDHSLERFQNTSSSLWPKVCFVYRSVVGGVPCKLRAELVPNPNLEYFLFFDHENECGAPTVRKLNVRWGRGRPTRVPSRQRLSLRSAGEFEPSARVAGTPKFDEHARHARERFASSVGLPPSSCRTVDKSLLHIRIFEYWRTNFLGVPQSAVNEIPRPIPCWPLREVFFFWSRRVLIFKNKYFIQDAELREPESPPSPPPPPKAGGISAPNSPLLGSSIRCETPSGEIWPTVLPSQH